MYTALINPISKCVWYSLPKHGLFAVSQKLSRAEILIERYEIHEYVLIYHTFQGN